MEEIQELVSAPVATTIPATQKAPPKSLTEDGVFTSTTTQLLVGEKRYTLRILKMIGSTLLIVCNSDPECIDELAVAMPMPQSNNKVLATTILGPHVITDSQRLSEKLSKRFGRQFFVSYNVQPDRMNGPLLEQHLSEYVRSHEAEFT